VPEIGFRLASLMLVLAVLVSAEPNVATAVTAAVAVLVVAALAGGAVPIPALSLPGRALRHRSRRTALLRQVSPDAPGRPRPRAPSAA
jgi:hypothetical protein